MAWTANMPTRISCAAVRAFVVPDCGAVFADGVTSVPVIPVTGAFWSNGSPPVQVPCTHKS